MGCCRIKSYSRCFCCCLVSYSESSTEEGAITISKNSLGNSVNITVHSTYIAVYDPHHCLFVLVGSQSQLSTSEAWVGGNFSNWTNTT